jgi:hypothetical protein
MMRLRTAQRFGTVVVLEETHTYRSPLTRRLAFGAWRSAFGVRRSCSCFVACRRGVSTQLEAPSRNCTPLPRGWRCFQGESRCAIYPGLKPWAILFCHFMARACPAGTSHQSPITLRPYCGMACAGTPPLWTTRRSRVRIPRQYFRGNKPIPMMTTWLATKASRGPNA